MTIRRFTKPDMRHIFEWRKTREVVAILPELYSSIGFIAEDANGAPVAAGFLTTTNTALCLIENIITNPNSIKSDREIAMIEVLDALQEEAKNRGYRYLIGITDNPRVEMYVEKQKGVRIHDTAKIFGKEL